MAFAPKSDQRRYTSLNLKSFCGCQLFVCFFVLFCCVLFCCVLFCVVLCCAIVLCCIVLYWFVWCDFCCLFVFAFRWKKFVGFEFTGFDMFCLVQEAVFDLVFELVYTGARMLARPLSPLSDPMTGFFAVSSEAWKRGRTRVSPVGFKICMETYIKCGITSDQLVEVKKTTATREGKFSF